jgi:LysM repeat protein
MKLPSLFTRKKLRATTARRSLGAPDEMDYEEMSEPNMKLSRALLIVLVLHVVAVAGIIAFNTIKNRQGPVPSVTKTSSNATTSQTVAPKSNPPAVATSDSASAPRDETAARSTPKPAVKEERKAIPVKPTAENSPKSESKKTYVVAKGDNPASIARKFKISSDQLLSANKIDDPLKLKIGQKLIIPTKATKPKKEE